MVNLFHQGRRLFLSPKRSEVSKVSFGTSERLLEVRRPSANSERAPWPRVGEPSARTRFFRLGARWGSRNLGFFGWERDGGRKISVSSAGSAKGVEKSRFLRLGGSFFGQERDGGRKISVSSTGSGMRVEKSRFLRPGARCGPKNLGSFDRDPLFWAGSGMRVEKSRFLRPGARCGPKNLGFFGWEREALRKNAVLVERKRFLVRGRGSGPEDAVRSEPGPMASGLRGSVSPRRRHGGPWPPPARDRAPARRAQGR